jgi:hypothetical protein
MTKTINLSNGNTVSFILNSTGKEYFFLKYKFSNGNKGIPTKYYNEIKAAAQELATKHPEWPKGVKPSNEIIIDSNLCEIGIKPETKISVPV